MSAELRSASVCLSYLTLGALDVGCSLCHLALQLHQYGCRASEALLRSLLQRAPLPLQALRWDVRLQETCGQIKKKKGFSVKYFVFCGLLYAFNRASIVERRQETCGEHGAVTPRPPGTLIALFINTLKSCLLTNEPIEGFHEPHHVILRPCKHVGTSDRTDVSCRKLSQLVKHKKAFFSSVWLKAEQKARWPLSSSGVMETKQSALQIWA